MNAITHWPRFLTRQVIMIVPTLPHENVNYGALAPERQPPCQALGFQRWSVVSINECRSVGTIKPSSHRCPRRTHSMAILNLILLLLLPCLTWQAQAACTSGYASANYCLAQPKFDTLGGDIKTGAFQITASTMYPVQAQTTTAELAYWQQKAVTNLQAGKDFWNGLFLIGVNPQDGSALASMLNNPLLNYETAGLLGNVSFIETGLIQARDTFAYHLYWGYPDATTARVNLLDAVKTLANLYLIIADEYLIDALEWRFPANTVGADAMLDVQINLLTKAQDNYQKAVNVFVSGFSLAVGTNITISDSFDEAVYGLFNLSVERLSLTLREKSSKQLVRNMVPDPMGVQAAATLKSANVNAYLATAAIAQKRGLNFDDANAGNSLINAINMLRKQGNIYTQGLNPLGYDNRYVPANDFQAILSRAKNYIATASNAKTALDSEKRAFDSNYEALQAQLTSLRTQYMLNLASYTGCSIPTNPDDANQRLVFQICTGEAGYDLFNCPTELMVSQFNTCISALKTKGSLATKYRGLMDTHIRLTSAVLRRDNYIQRIDFENQKANRLIEIKRNLNGAMNAKIDEYLPKLMAARSIVETNTEESKREWDSQNKKWKKSPKTRTNTTSESFSIRDDKLLINTNQEKDLRNITMEFDIQNIDASTAYAIKDLMLNEAEAEIEIDASIQQQNSALVDFNNLMQEKENLWQFFDLAQNQLNYYASKAPQLRVLRSQAALDLSNQLNNAAQFAYLAAKALEYQYVRDLTSIQMTTGIFRITDIFKAQTPGDIQDYVGKLENIDTLKCSWGSFGMTYKDISLARHILGQINTTDLVRRAAVQDFIKPKISWDNVLKFKFTLSESASFLTNSVLYNTKIWDGAGPTGCSGPNIGKGVAVSLESNQSSGGYWYPQVTLRQTGHSSLKGGDGVYHEYIPVYSFEDLLTSNSYVPSIAFDFAAYVGNPRFANTWPGTWATRFKGRSIASAEWEVTIYDPFGNDKTDFNKITDIVFHFDTLSQSK